MNFSFFKIIKLPIFLCLALLLWSCNSDDAADQVSAEDLDIKEYVYEVMKQYYLWYDEVPADVDLSTYSSAVRLLDDLKNTDDRFSFITEDGAAFFAAIQGGASASKGMGLGINSDNELRVGYVYPNSPAAEAGIKRGFEITKINGFDWTVDNANELLTTAVDHFAEVTYIDHNGEEHSAALSSEQITKSAILHREVIEQDEKKIGYFVFDTFLEYAEAEIGETFSFFQNQGINELIVDLRYNGGGLVSTAQRMGGIISPASAVGNIFSQTLYNDQQSVNNTEIRFEVQNENLNLQRVIFLTTGNSASASEMLLNGLKPYMDVVQIGESTYGKYVGGPILEHKGHAFLPITFKFANANGDSDFVDGIAPDFAVEDVMRKDFGDPEEALLKAALQYYSEGIVSGNVQGRPSQSPMSVNDNDPKYLIFDE